MGVMKPICFGLLLAAGLADASLPVRWRTLTSSKAGYYNAKVVIPIFQSSDPVARLANQELGKKARLLLNAFVSSSKDQKFKPFAPYEYQVSATIGVAEPGLVSYYLTEYSYTGGAHGNTALTGWTYGMTGGRPGALKFANLQRNRMESRAAATAIVLPALNEAKRKRGADPVEELPPTFVDNFVITPAGITWLFSPYEVGAYAEGSYSIKIPWIDMQGTVRKPAALGPEETEMIDRGFVNLAGKAAYRERIMMPPGSTAVYRLSAGPSLVGEATSSVSQAMAGFQVRFPTKSWPAGVPGSLRILFLDPDGKARFVTSEPIRIERWGTEAPINAMLISSSAVGLEDVDWKLVEIDGEGMPEGRTRRPTLRFEAKSGRFYAMGGVNQISGSYVVSGKNLSIKLGPATLMAGPQEDMDRESLFARNLGMATRFAIEGKTLRIMRGESVGLTFERD
jgi:heat shock protein HslJ